MSQPVRQIRTARCPNRTAECRESEPRRQRQILERGEPLTSSFSILYCRWSATCIASVREQPRQSSAICRRRQHSCSLRQQRRYQRYRSHGEPLPGFAYELVVELQLVRWYRRGHGRGCAGVRVVGRHRRAVDRDSVRQGRAGGRQNHVPGKCERRADRPEGDDRGRRGACRNFPGGRPMPVPSGRVDRDARSCGRPCGHRDAHAQRVRMVRVGGRVVGHALARFGPWRRHD